MLFTVRQKINSFPYDYHNILQNTTQLQKFNACYNDVILKIRLHHVQTKH